MTVEKTPFFENRLSNVDRFLVIPFLKLLTRAGFPPRMVDVYEAMHKAGVRLDDGTTLNQLAEKFQAIGISCPELEWMMQNESELAQHEGEWVAVTGSGIIAVGQNYSELHLNVQATGVRSWLPVKPS